jgi:Kef-type K+ transport system membrane component KefB
MSLVLFGYLTIVALALALVFAAFAAVHVKRLGDRTPAPISEEIGSAKAVLNKVRKREPMSKDELDYAKQIVADRSSLMAFCIPGTLFMLGCFYVFGSLYYYYLHGATPSERTFLGVIPMLTSTNLAIRLLRSARLKGRLRKMS